MNDTVNDAMESVRKESEARSAALQRLLSTADSSKVFGAPVSSAGYTAIPAAEVMSGGGFGSGMGFGSPHTHRKQAADEASGIAGGGPEEAGEVGPAMEGAGGGGGGGGGAMARPVAVIVVGPDGVRVKPVLDITKLGLTALGLLGTVLAISVRMLKKRK